MQIRCAESSKVITIVIIVFVDPENMGIDTGNLLLRVSEAEILAKIIEQGTS